MDDEGIELFHHIRPQKQPAGGLDQQKHRAQPVYQPPLPVIFPAAGNGHAEKQAVNQHQPIVKDPQKVQKAHNTPSFWKRKSIYCCRTVPESSREMGTVRPE